MMPTQRSSEADPDASTRRFYRAHADEYARRTLAADVSHLYPPFLRLLKPGAEILDIGCGAGRDILAFRKRGFNAWGMDASPELARLAHQLTGARVDTGKIEELDLGATVDGIWACASLLHLARRKLPLALDRIAATLGAGGIFFASMQEGAGDSVDPDGRFFALYDQSQFSELVASAGFELLAAWTTSDSLPGREGPEWINLLSRKAS